MFKISMDFFQLHKFKEFINIIVSPYNYIPTWNNFYWSVFTNLSTFTILKLKSLWQKIK
jgi:hypothetical protein